MTPGGDKSSRPPKQPRPPKPPKQPRTVRKGKKPGKLVWSASEEHVATQKRRFNEALRLFFAHCDAGDGHDAGTDAMDLGDAPAGDATSAPFASADRPVGVAKPADDTDAAAAAASGASAMSVDDSDRDAMVTSSADGVAAPTAHVTESAPNVASSGVDADGATTAREDEGQRVAALEHGGSSATVGEEPRPSAETALTVNTAATVCRGFTIGAPSSVLLIPRPSHIRIGL